jgi:hypothetical protein
MIPEKKWAAAKSRGPVGANPGMDFAFERRPQKIGARRALSDKNRRLKIRPI